MTRNKTATSSARRATRFYSLLAAGALLAGGPAPLFAQSGPLFITHGYTPKVVDFGIVRGAFCGGPAAVERDFIAQVNSNAIGSAVYGNTAIPVVPPAEAAAAAAADTAGDVDAAIDIVTDVNAAIVSALTGQPIKSPLKKPRANFGGLAVERHGVFTVTGKSDYLYLNKPYPMTAVLEPIEEGYYETTFRVTLGNYLRAQRLMYQWYDSNEFQNALDDARGRHEQDIDIYEGKPAEELAAERKAAKREAVKETIASFVRKYFFGPVPATYLEHDVVSLTIKARVVCPADPAWTGTGFFSDRLAEFETPQTDPGGALLATLTPSPLAVGDVNNDGLNDVAAVDIETNTVNILLGADAGAPALRQSQQLPAASSVQAVTLKDVNGDGNDDLMVQQHDAPDALVFYGDGDGSFDDRPVLMRQGQTQASGDLDGDQTPDLVVLNEIAGQVSVYLGDGGGGYLHSQDLSAGYEPNGVLISDLNGDNVVDLLVNNADDVSVFAGNGDGTFRDEQVFAVRD